MLLSYKSLARCCAGKRHTQQGGHWCGDWIQVPCPPVVIHTWPNSGGVPRAGLGCPTPVVLHSAQVYVKENGCCWSALRYRLSAVWVRDQPEGRVGKTRRCQLVPQKGLTLCLEFGIGSSFKVPSNPYHSVTRIFGHGYRGSSRSVTTQEIILSKQ